MAKILKINDSNIHFNADLIYPVGSIYMSVNSTNPSTFFGGTWEQIKDKFLLACGNSYGNGSTGGSTTHTHTYGLRATNYFGTSDIFGNSNLTGVLNYSDSSSYTIGIEEYKGRYSFELNSGYERSISTVSSSDIREMKGNASYSSTMPPYLAVYVWKRTA